MFNVFDWRRTGSSAESMAFINLHNCTWSLLLYWDRHNTTFVIENKKVPFATPSLLRHLDHLL